MSHLLRRGQYLKAERDDDKNGTWLIPEDASEELVVRDLGKKRHHTFRPMAVFIPDNRKTVKKKRPVSIIEPAYQPASPTLADLPQAQFDEAILQDMKPYELWDICAASKIEFDKEESKEELIAKLVTIDA